MPAMPSHKNSLPLPHPHVPLAGHAYPIHHLEEQGAASTLQAPSTDRFIRRAKDNIGGSHRQNSACFSDAFMSDDFQMYDYKVRQCMRGRSHDWTVCPFAHPGEKARRRDPRKIHYSGEPCPDFRKGSCRKGDACEYAHGVFECWLHPAKYRTQPCKDGKDCTRRVCFFAHSMQQLRPVAVPIKESRAEGASVKSNAQELYSHIHELRSPEGMCLLEDSFKWRVPMGDSYEHEVGLPPQTNSSALSSRDGCANVGSTFEAPSMLTSSYPNISGSPFEAISTVGFSSNNAMGVPLEVHPPSPMFSTIAPGLYVGSPMFSMYEQSSEPVTFSPASTLQLYTPVLGGISSSYGHTTSKHSPYMGHKEGEPICNANLDVSDMAHYGGCGDTAMLHRFMNASGRSRPDANEVVNELDGASKSVSLTDQLALLRSKEYMYTFSSHDSHGIYGLSSPTSTLTGPLYPTPFSSPPLSPLSIQSSETSNVFSIRGHGNVQVDAISPKADAHFQNTHCGNELGITHASTDQYSLHSHHHSQLAENGVLPQCLEMPSFSQCTFVDNKWIPTCNIWNSEGAYKCGVSQLTTDDMQKKNCDRFGDNSPAENAMPDLGWVHDLVK